MVQFNAGTACAVVGGKHLLRGARLRLFPWKTELISDESTQCVPDFFVAWNGGLLTGPGIHVKVVFGAVAIKKATLSYQLADELAPLQEANSTVTFLRLGGTGARDSLSIMSL
jgi:hypothetical protein